MKRKFEIIISIVSIALCFAVFAACDDTQTHDGVKVVYMLEGGTFQNADGSVVQYYDFAKGTQNRIKPLQEFAKDSDLVNNGYDFQGWYKTKTVNGDKATYSDLWDFEKDTVGDEGVTLYAYWTLTVKHTYEIRDYDTDEVVASVTVEKDVPFNDRFASRAGYTMIGAYDANKNAWDYDFVHPGGETDLAVVVYAKYIEGSYTVVTTASELKTASTRNNNIYLANDIDMQGATLSFENFKKEFLGGNHTVSNFTVLYSDKNKDLITDPEDDSKKSLAISLFPTTSNAKIVDVNFENVTIDVSTSNSSIYKIYVAPLVVNAENTVINNVAVQGTVKITKAQTSAGVAITVSVERNAAAIFKDDNSSVSDFVSNLTIQDN